MTQQTLQLDSTPNRRLRYDWVIAVSTSRAAAHPSFQPLDQIPAAGRRPGPTLAS
jgi:hypothetical protein